LTSHWLGRPAEIGLEERQPTKSQDRFLQAMTAAHSTKDYTVAKMEWDNISWPMKEESEFKIFVEKTLDLVFSQREEGRELDGQILGYFLEKGLLKKDSMKGGLLQGVARAGRWDELDKIMRGVFNLSEDDLMEVLFLAVEHSRTTSPIDQDAMQVDRSSSASDQHLSTYLASCVLYPTAPAPLQLAIHKHLRDPEHLLCVLKILEGWVRTWAKADVKLLPPKKVVANEFGVKVWTESKMDTGLDKIPPYHRVRFHYLTIFLLEYLGQIF
jgi:hypothetical protein